VSAVVFVWQCFSSQRSNVFALKSRYAYNGAFMLQLARPMKDEADRRAWIAARFDGEVPPEMNVGDGSTIGDYVNWPLTKRRAYKIFVRAFTIDNVSCFNMTSCSRYTGWSKKRNAGFNFAITSVNVHRF